MTKQTDIKALETILENADNLYYTFGQSDLSDAQYDSLLDRLKLIDPKNKRFKDKKVGAEEDTNSKWEKAPHGNFPMGSQSKVNTQKDLFAWAEGKKADEFCVQEKLDGISIKMIYKNGNIVSAITRGSGKDGEVITRNVTKMKWVPKKISYMNELIIRGEVMLHTSDLIHFKDSKTARNSAAGAAKKLNGEGCEHLTVHVYDVMNWKDTGKKTNREVIDWLKQLNFNPVTTYYCKSKEAVQSVMDCYIKEKRKELDWVIDGLVVKCDPLQDDEWEHPKLQTAYKFPSEEGVTKLIDVKWQDRGGRITPVGILEPINIGGVTISKATLNNIDHIKSLGIKIGDTVTVSRRNDVIPCIEGVALASPDGIDIEAPTHDDEGFPIVQEENSEGKKLVFLISTNPNSKTKRIRRILTWFKSHETKGIAGATIESILNAGVAKDLPDFFDVCLNGDSRLLDIDGFGKGVFKILRQSALKTKETTIVNFFNGLDINGFSEKSFESILLHVNKDTSVSEFVNICKDITLISSIDGFGMNSALALKNEMEKNSKLIDEMVSRVKVNSWSPGKVNTNTTITGKSFCFTGKAENDRGDLEKMVRENGGVIAGVSKNLDYLVTNDPNSGSGKNKKADDLGIEKITETQFLKLIKGN